MSRRQMAPSNHDEVLIQDEVQRSQGWIGKTMEIHPIRSSRGNGPIRAMNSPKNEVTTTLDESAIDDAQLLCRFDAKEEQAVVIVTSRGSDPSPKFQTSRTQ